jgi:hypothetical protein
MEWDGMVPHDKSGETPVQSSKPFLWHVRVDVFFAFSGSSVGLILRW